MRDPEGCEKHRLVSVRSRYTSWLLCALAIALLTVQITNASRTFVAKIHSFAGVTASNMEAFDAARLWFQRAVIWNPYDYESHCQLGQVRRKLNDIEGARRSFEFCLRLAPNDTNALVGLAEVLAITGDPTAAQEAVRKAQDIAPESPRVHYAAGFAAGKAGMNAIAVAEFEKALSLEFTPRHVALRQLAIAYNSTGETAKALECLTEATELDPINAEYHLVKGQILLSLNRPEQSIASLSRCVNLLSAVPTLGPPERMTLEMACVSLCQAHLVNKNVLESCHYLLQCVQINPASIPARIRSCCPKSR